jgi:hypothetical protein
MHFLLIALFAHSIATNKAKPILQSRSQFKESAGTDSRGQSGLAVKNFYAAPVAKVVIEELKNFLKLSPMISAKRLFARKTLPHHRIQISLRDLSQLFNSMDPAPFHEKDLDRNAEEFIESWVSEFPRNEPVSLDIYLQQWPESPDAQEVAEKAIHNYFAYRTQLNRREFSRLIKQGRTSLMIGFLFLAACLLASQVIAPLAGTALHELARESLLIVGWVALWKPLEIYLYDWWPLRRRGVILRKMSEMPVELRRRP